MTGMYDYLQSKEGIPTEPKVLSDRLTAALLRTDDDSGRTLVERRGDGANTFD